MSKLAIDAINAIKYKIAFSCVLVLVSLTSAGCDNGKSTGIDIYETTEVESLAYSDGVRAVAEPRTIKYLVPNSLVETEMSETVGIETFTYQSYSGLASDAMEIAINMNIQDLIDEMRQSLEPESIVPYRGIKKLITKDAKVIQTNVYCYTSFNYNNILCVQAYGSGAYNIKENQSLVYLNPNFAQGDVYLSTVKSLVIDLGTGKPIPLKGLFIDGYDYVSVINDYIVKEIGRYSATDENADSFLYSPFKLVKPFDGIDVNQPFSIDAYGVSILFDPSDDRFESNFNTASINIPLAVFGDNLAFDTRYYTEGESIFDDKTEKRAFPAWVNGSNYREEYHNGTYKGGNWSVTVSKMNAFENEILDQMVTDEIDALNNITSNDTKGGIYVQYSATIVGNYVIISRNYWNDDNGEAITSNDTFIFDATGQILKLADLFVPNYEYLAVIKQKMMDEWGTISEREIERMLDVMQFTISIQSIDLRFSPDEGENPYESLWLSLPFDAFGIENMIIFD